MKDNLIPDKILREVCLIGKRDKCCRYIIVSPDGIECAKKSNLKGVIDKRVADHLMVACGDNCDGI